MYAMSRLDVNPQGQKKRSSAMKSGRWNMSDLPLGVLALELASAPAIIGTWEQYRCFRGDF